MQLSLSFFHLQVDHSDLFFLLSDLLLAVLEDVLLNVRLFVENTKFIVSVNQLDTHVVSALTCLLILVDKVVHVFLERVDGVKPSVKPDVEKDVKKVVKKGVEVLATPHSVRTLCLKMREEMGTIGA